MAFAECLLLFRCFLGVVTLVARCNSRIGSEGRFLDLFLGIFSKSLVDVAFLDMRMVATVGSFVSGVLCGTASLPMGVEFMLGVRSG